MRNMPRKTDSARAHLYNLPSDLIRLGCGFSDSGFQKGRSLVASVELEYPQREKGIQTGWSPLKNFSLYRKVP